MKPLAKEKVVGIWEKFASTTVIRVFNFIKISSFLYERIFWISLLITFTALTVSNVCDTIQTFLTEETSSSVSFNDSLPLALPNTIVCVKIEPPNWVGLDDESVELVLDSFVAQSDIIAYFRGKVAAVKQLDARRPSIVNETVQKAYLRSNGSISNVFTRRDRALIGWTGFMLTDVVRVEQLQTPINDSVHWTNRQLQKIADFYRNRSTNYEALFRLTAQLTCILMEIKLIVVNYNPQEARSEFTSFDLCAGDVFSFGAVAIGASNFLCLRVPPRDPTPTGAIHFRGAHDYVVLALHPTLLYRSEKGLNAGYLIVDFSGLMDLEKQPPAILVEPDKQQQVIFDLQVVSTSMSLWRSPCAHKNNRNLSNLECAYWCRVEFIEKVCGCVSFSSVSLRPGATLPKVPKETPYCGQGPQLSGDQIPNMASPECVRALKKTSFKESQTNCSRKCLPNCETYLFAARTPTDLDVNFVPDYNGTVAMLRPQKFVYQRIDESLKMTAKGLMSALGGNLSLYLGASFLALIHIVVFMLKLPFEWSSAGRTQSEETKVSVIPAAMTCNCGSAFGVRQIFAIHSQEIFTLHARLAALEEREQRRLKTRTDFE